jgi:hypothetical protein
MAGYLQGTNEEILKKFTPEMLSQLSPQQLTMLHMYYQHDHSAFNKLMEEAYHKLLNQDKEDSSLKAQDTLSDTDWQHKFQLDIMLRTDIGKYICSQLESCRIEEDQVVTRRYVDEYG